MKINESHLRNIVREALVVEALCENAPVPVRSRACPEVVAMVRGKNIEEGWFSGGLKGLMRSIPGIGNVAADAHTSAVIDELDKKLTNMERRIARLESSTSTGRRS